MVIANVSLPVWEQIQGMSWDTMIWQVQSHQFWEELSLPPYEHHSSLFTLFGLLYIPLVFGGIKLMQPFTSFNPGYWFTFWNFLMATFSAWGAIATGIPLFHAIANGITSHELVCDFWIYSYPTMSQLAVFFFVVSKVFEFIDTIFLVIKKKPVIFLHWYHHVITYLFTWYSNIISANHNAAGFHFCFMNYFVHAFMYFYYMLVSMRIYPKWDLFITVIQLTQMVLGVVIITIATTCDTTDWSQILFGYVLYASFFYLFVQIFNRRYMTDSGFRVTASPSAQQAAATPTTKPVHDTKAEQAKKND